MGIFRVGQRVRIVSDASFRSDALVLLGREGVITHPRGWNGNSRTQRSDRYGVDVDGVPGPNGRPWCIREYRLLPLTDPLADAWAADAVRKVTKPEPVAPKVPEKVTT